MIELMAHILLIIWKISLGSDMKPFKFAVGLMIAVSACLAQAIPLTTNAPSGYEGNTVTVVLTEPNPSDLIGITINFSYNTNILTLISSAAGNIATPNSFVSVTEPSYLAPEAGGVVSISYDAAINTGGSLMELAFTINSGVAPTTTLVNFSCFDYGQGFGCEDYDFGPVAATVTVLEPATTPIPLPGTLPLLGLGVAALWWSRRRTV